VPTERWRTPQDLELLARSAYMLGRDDDYVDALERAYRAYLDAGDATRAVRCAFWIGHNMLFRGETARATGWFARAQRLFERDQRECVERGYLLIPVWLGQMASGDYEAGCATAVEAAAIGERFGDADLAWLARDEQGRALVRQGRVDEGLRLVDEVMVAATAGELSPLVAGIVRTRRCARRATPDGDSSRSVRAPTRRVLASPAGIPPGSSRHGAPARRNSNNSTPAPPPPSAERRRMRVEWND
jgi:hypothetical protein